MRILLRAIFEPQKTNLREPCSYGERDGQRFLKRCFWHLIALSSPLLYSRYRLNLTAPNSVCFQGLGIPARVLRHVRFLRRTSSTRIHKKQLPFGNAPLNTPRDKCQYTNLGIRGADGSRTRVRISFPWLQRTRSYKL